MHDFAISRRDLPEVCFQLPALSNQRAQGMPGARCARSRVCNDSERRTRVSTGHTGNRPAFPAQWF